MAVFTTPNARAVMVGPVIEAFVVIVCSNSQFHLRTALSPARGGPPQVSISHEPAAAACAGRLGVAIEVRVATTTAAITSKVVTNLCFMRFSLPQCTNPRRPRHNTAPGGGGASP